MKDKGRERWAAIRAKGRAAYIVRYGVLGWGIPTGVVATGLMAVWDRVATENWPALHLTKTLSGVLVYALGGILFGWIMWYLSESRYLKH